jgi:hypothetical protein
MRTNLLLIALLAITPVAAATPPPEDVPAALKSQTQALMNAITNGTPAVWEQALDDAATITDEGGSVSTKAELVKSIHSLPKGVSGSIEIVDFRAFVHGSAAVTNYVSDEHENYHGHALHCQYRATDTWIRHASGWRLIASQVLALKTDPPAIALTAEKANDYVGRYALDESITYEIRMRDGKLEGKRSDRPTAEALSMESPDVFFVGGNPRYRKVFQRDDQGRITGFVERREAWDIAWARLPAK